MKFVKGYPLSICALVLGVFTLNAPRDAHSFAYIFAGEANGIDVVTHALGYNGTGGTVSISVGIDPTSTFAGQMLIPTQNVVNTWNGLTPTTGNLNSSGISGSQVDYESTLLHELGHSLGLAHVNAASESGLSGSNRNYTKATDGADNTFNINAGTDGIIGSADDIRGDDVNLNYFRKSDNNPVNIPGGGLGVVDSTTYSRDLSDLPGGDNFSANADRAVAAALGFADTESVMQQGTFFGETQRSLTADDVAGILYAGSGLDEIAGTADDYTVVLNFLGLDAGADILIDFDNAETGFAVSQSGGTFLNSDHIAINSTEIFFNSGSNWFFNQESNISISEPGLLVVFSFGLFGLVVVRRCRAR
ncbi:MAG: hypothetical protein GKS01_19600 [Alphaproteobacteria bacterium]|nr:hypothetical protein [Alphaproteobacteria bacterium]